MISIKKPKISIKDVSKAIDRAGDEVTNAIGDLVGDIDVNAKLEDIALPIAQSWKNDNPEAQPGSPSDFDDCVSVVAAGTAAAATIAASSLGPWGTALGAAVGAGGGVAVARIACRRVLS